MAGDRRGSIRSGGRRAFTLIELLVVIAIISVLMTILLPSLASARRQAKVTVGLANLRSMTQVMILYTNDHREDFLNPFRSDGGNWTDAVGSGDSGLRWDFSSSIPQWNTEFFAYYWYSFLAEWRSEGRVDEAMVSPADADLLSQLRQLRSQPETLNKFMLHPSSFLYSPTFWSDSERFRGGSRLAMSEPSLRTASVGSVSSPSAKVLIFERADFAQSKRVEIAQSGGSTRGSAPAWNNPRARTSIGMADGSVDQVSIADLTRRAATSEGAAYLPGGDLAVPDGLPLVPDNAHRGQFQTGGTPSSTDARYPLFFWATNGGVKGRDIPR